MKDALRKVISFDFGSAATLEPTASRIDTLVGDGRQRTALLATADRLSKHWAPRWLEYAGLDVRVATTPDMALDLASVQRPALMIVDAAFQDEESCLLINALRNLHEKDVPLIALCSNASDIALSTDAAATDVVRRPFDWQIITQRAVQAVRAREAQDALDIANDRLDHLEAATTAARRDRARTAGMDTVTGLPNSERFRQLSHSALPTRDSTVKQSSILVVGLDRFRMINDAIGRDSANRLLKKFADRLRGCISNRDVIGAPDNGTVTAIAARIEGARFAVQIANGDTQQIVRFSDAITEMLEQPFEIEGQSIYMTASVGAATYPLHCDTADGLLHGAENAMLEAKRTGGGLRVFQPGENASSLQILELDSMLRDALRNEEFELHYQPIVETGFGDVVAAEALLRWHHPTEGDISPATFVPAAERSGLMRDIGNFVIESACRQMRSWIDSGMEPVRVAINLSLCQLLRGDVVAVTQAALERFDIDPRLLEFELSERGVLNQRPEVVDEIHRLKKIGIRISIDDFGTGQAAIGYLKDLPIDVIKIDRSYVSGANRSARDEAIASGMVALAQRLQATVIAEGVETKEQFDMLREWGSHECQGFLFSKALPADEFRARYG